MDSRVTVREGSIPVLLIAPHGPDDKNTDILTEHMANKIDAYAVINWGWEKNNQNIVDCMEDFGNCNDLTHLHEEVIFEEFLKPILSYRHKIVYKHHIMYQYVIHGVGNDIRAKTNDFTTDIIVGNGIGTPNRLSTPMWKRDAFIYLAEKVGGMTTYAAEGKSYAGWARNNLNQIWNCWYNAPATKATSQSLQLELIYEARKNEETAKLYGEFLASVIKENYQVNKSKSEGLVPPDYQVKRLTK
jgi:hypothetical protein